MKKILILILAGALFLVSFFSLSGCSTQENQAEINGILWEYRKASGGTLCVYPAYEKIGDNGRKFFSDLSGEVKVPDEINGVKVSALDAKAFYDCAELESVVLPEGIEKIGKECFFGCVNLVQLNFPETLKSCGDHALVKTALKRITIGKNFRSFGDMTSEPFFGCTSLREIIVSSDNEMYASRAGVLFSKNMKTLYYYPPVAQASAYLLPDTVEKIERGAFSQCVNLECLVFPKSLKQVNDVFYRCEKLGEIQVPKEKLEEYRNNDLYQEIKIKAVS